MLPTDFITVIAAAVPTISFPNELALFIPNIDFTISIACFLNVSIIIASARPPKPCPVILIALETNITYIKQSNGCTNTLNTNSFTHVSNAWLLLSFILSTEYVIVIIGAIKIKKPIVIIRFIYTNKYPNKAVHNIIYIIAPPIPSNGSSVPNDIFTSSSIYVLYCAPLCSNCELCAFDIISTNPLFTFIVINII